MEMEEKKVTDEEQIEEFFENRILKPLPDYSFNPELKELAVSIQNEIINTNPGVNFRDIVGLDEAKRLLKEELKICRYRIYAGKRIRDNNLK